MAEGALAGGMGDVSALNGAIISGKGTFSARGAPSLAKGAPYMLNRTQSCVKRAPFRARRAPLLTEGAPYLLRGRRQGEKAPFRTRRASMLARGDAVSD